MGVLSGEIRDLRARVKNDLEKLATYRTAHAEIIGSTLLQRAAKLSAELGRQLGLLITREGKVAYVVVGTKTRIYLPDLGRFRLNQAYLRRLRFVVFFPDGEKQLELLPSGQVFGTQDPDHQDPDHVEKKQKKIYSPRFPGDLLTDLEKLRFDLVMIVAVSEKGSASAVSVAALEPAAAPVSPNGSGIVPVERVRSLTFFHAREVHDLGFDFTEFIEDLEERFVSSRQVGFDTADDHALVVGAYTGTEREAELSLSELLELCRTAEIQVLDVVSQRRKKLDPRTVIGKGKLEDIVLRALDLGADLLIFDRELSPGQLRSITNLTELRVIDRSMLILDIFSQRAKSSEGKLQVELAQLRYSLPRLTETDTGLSRLTGGIGGRGPGETKLEIGRRRARKRISDLEKKVEKIASQRELRRERRQVRGVPVISIVGYTNAGKSTLLNAVTKSDVFVESKMFATLDPSSRRMRFPNEKEVVFVDTVGFIRELPKELVAAFRVTLEEVGQSDLLLHVVDATDLEMKKQIEVVIDTLDSLGFGDKPRILVLNKTDLLSPLEAKTLENTLHALPVSAVTRDGLEALMREVQEALLESFEGQDPGRFMETPGWEQ